MRTVSADRGEKSCFEIENVAEETLETKVITANTEQSSETDARLRNEEFEETIVTTVEANDNLIR